MPPQEPPNRGISHHMSYGGMAQYQQELLFTSSDGFEGDTIFHLPSHLTDFDDEDHEANISQENHFQYQNGGSYQNSPNGHGLYDARNHTFFEDEVSRNLC